MLWLQSLASFAEYHGRGKVTAFLDRAASLCPFLAVFSSLSCVFRQWECVSEGFAVLLDWAGSSVHLIDCLFAILSVLQLLYGLAIHCLPLISLSLFFFFYFWKLSLVISCSLLLFYLFPDFFSLLNPCKSLHCCYRRHRKLLFPQCWKLTSIYLMTRGKTPDVNSFLYPSLCVFLHFFFHSLSFPQLEISVSVRQPAESRNEAQWFEPISGTSVGLLLKIRSASVSLIDSIVVVSLVSMLGFCPMS